MNELIEGAQASAELGKDGRTVLSVTTAYRDNKATLTPEQFACVGEMWERCVAVRDLTQPTKRRIEYVR